MAIGLVSKVSFSAEVYQRVLMNRHNLKRLS